SRTVSSVTRWPKRWAREAGGSADAEAMLRGASGRCLGECGQTSRRFMRPELKHLASDGDWAAYHAIRRRVLFELRGNFAYDDHHPDERRAGHHPFLLWDAGSPVGTIRIDVDQERAIFRRVAIRVDLQRRGYGRQLLQAAEAFARQEHCTRVESHVDLDAVGFYERCGFVHANPHGIAKHPLMFNQLG